MSKVDISVIMPVYNTPGYILQRAVRSVTDQVGLDTQHELVVVDDGSTAPATLQALYKLKMYDGVRVLHVGKNSGQSTARNVGVFAARGDFLAFLDADDIMFRTNLTLHYHYMCSGCDLVFGQFALLNHIGNRVKYGQVAEFVTPVHGMLCPASLESSPEGLLPYWREWLKLGNLTLLGTVMMRKDHYITVGGCEPNLVCSEDWLLERRLLNLNGIQVHYIKEPTFWYCRYDQSFNLNQSRKLHEPNKSAFHLDTNHAAGHAGEYLDKKARVRADRWLAGDLDLPEWEEVE